MKYLYKLIIHQDTKTELLTYKEDIVEKNRITATYNKNTSQFSTENFLPMKNKLLSKSVKKVLDPFWGHTKKSIILMLKILESKTIFVLKVHTDKMLD